MRSALKRSAEAAPSVDLRLRCFVAQAHARAYLWLTRDIEDLHEAVDRLQTDAERNGIVAMIGQQAVQDYIADAFSPAREIAGE